LDETEQVIKIDLSDLSKVMESQTRTIIESLRIPEGKGVVAPPKMSNAGKLVEQLKKVGKNDWMLTEQWTIVIPNYITHEIAAHLRDYVFVSDALNGEGDVANIPYVMDFDFEILGAVGNAFAGATANIITSLQTTLYESGAWTDVPYFMIERIDQNLLDELNSRFAVASVRSEDSEIMQLIMAGTTTNYAGNVTRRTGAANFYAANVPAAIRLLMLQGKNVKPGDCLLYLTPSAYTALLTELAASQIIAYAVPSIITQGIIEEYLGVRVVVGGYSPYQQRTNAATGTVDLCFLMRPKRAVALAPKRELLVESQKQVATRQLRLTASHTFAVRVLDFKEIVRIWTSYVRAGA